MAMLTPGQLAKSGTEHAHQVALFCWAQQNTKHYPELSCMYAIPNGGQRNKAVAANLKAEGVKAGVPDICLPVRKSHSGSLYVELKRPVNSRKSGRKKGTVQQVQSEFMDKLKSTGQSVIVCYGWESAAEAILSYLRSK